MILKKMNFIFVSLIIAQLLTTSSTNSPKGKETSTIVHKFTNSFSGKKLPLNENSRINSLTCFKHQININVALLSCLLLVISLLSTAVLPRKTSAFS